MAYSFTCVMIDCERLYWQNVVDLFNEQNPAGSLTSSEDYRTILIVANVVAVLVTFKRFWLGIFLGRQTFGKIYVVELFLIQIDEVKSYTTTGKLICPCKSRRQRVMLRISPN
jgi:hypothetical protein